MPLIQFQDKVKKVAELARLKGNKQETRYRLI